MTIIPNSITANNYIILIIMTYYYYYYLLFYQFRHWRAGEAEQGGAEGAIAPPIMFLEGHSPLKNNQSCNAVLYLNFAA